MQQAVQVHEAHRNRAQKDIEGVDLSTHRDYEQARADAELGSLGEVAFDLISPDACRKHRTAAYDFLYASIPLTIDVKTMRGTDPSYAWVRCRDSDEPTADAYVFLSYDGEEMSEIGLLYADEIKRLGEYVERENDHDAYRIDLDAHRICFHRCDRLF